jgi:hypothetical protein
VRLRAAFGVAGQQPLNGAALELEQLTTAWVNNQYASGYQVTNPGNPLLKPERSEEYEGGVDLGFWGNRVSVEFTGYQKTTQDALYNLPLGIDLNSQTFEENIGEVRNSGLEGTLTAVVIDSRLLLWSFTVNGSANRNELVHLAPGALPIVTGVQQQHAGYPLNGFWGGQEHYADLNHDGIIEPNEVTVDTAATYMGSSVPTQAASLATHIGLWHSAITVSAMLDYHGGYRVWNQLVQGDAVGELALPEQNVRGAPLWLQARAVAQLAGPPQVPSGFFEDGTMVRFRELSLSYTMPVRWSHAMRVASLSVTGGVRNLALWTRYTGGDPEVSDVASGTVSYNPLSGTTTINNNIRSSGIGAVPLTRDWFARVNVGL